MFLKRMTIFMVVAMLFTTTVFAKGDVMNLSCKSALLMDFATGTVLYENNAHEKLPMASVTKIMTMLLTVEAIERGELSTDELVTVTREAAKITDSAVYAGGLTLKELNGGSSRKYAVVLDLDTMNQETAIAPMIAGGMQIGEVYFSVRDGQLTVSAVLTVDGAIDKSNVYIATDAITAQTLGASRFSGTKTKLNRTIDLGDAPYAAVMVQLTVTYDPATAQAYSVGREEQKLLKELEENWRLMQMTTANEAVG